MTFVSYCVNVLYVVLLPLESYRRQAPLVPRRTATLQTHGEGQYDEGGSFPINMAHPRHLDSTLPPPPQSSAEVSRESRHKGNPSKANKLGHNPGLRKLRATRIINALLEPGVTRTAVAKKLGISTRTIKRELAYAENEGILKEAQQMLAEELVPRALEIFKRHMQMQIDRAERKGADPPDLDAAKEVLKGVHVFAGANSPSIFEEQKTDQEVLTLEAYYDRRSLNAPEPEHHPRLSVTDIQSEEEPRDGELLRGDHDQRSDDQGTGDPETEQRRDASSSDSGT